MYYASLVGPLLNLYFPVNLESKELCRVALNTSKLKSLWCDVYTVEETNIMIMKYGGTKLPTGHASILDYDSHEVYMARQEITMSGNTARTNGDKNAEIPIRKEFDDGPLETGVDHSRL